MDRDDALYAAKKQVTKLICNLITDDVNSTAPHNLAGAVDSLNESWDSIINILHARLKVKQQIIDELTSNLAEYIK